MSDAASHIRLRMERRNTLCMAIADCDPDDALQIITAVLAGMETAGPQHDLIGTARSDAEWWASLAPPHELQAYTYSGLRALARQTIPTAIRLRLMALLWNGLMAADKREFLRRMTGGDS